MSTDIFAKFSQPKEVSADAVTAWIGILSKLIADLNTESVSTAEYESKVRKSWETEEASGDLTDLMNEFQHRLFLIIDQSPVDAVHSYTMLRELTSRVKDERDYHVKHEARLSKPKAAVGDDFTEKKDDAVKVKDHIENLYNLSTMSMFDWPESVTVKKLKDGSTKPDLPRIPSGPREGNAGRKPVGSNLRLTVNGDEFLDHTVSQVCHDVLSVGAKRVNVTDLIAQVESEGFKFSEGWDVPITVNGFEVIGTVIKTDDSAEESEESDD